MALWLSRAVRKRHVFIASLCPSHLNWGSPTSTSSRNSTEHENGALIPHPHSIATKFEFTHKDPFDFRFRGVSSQGYIDSYKSKRPWFQKQSIALLSGLRETVVNEGKEESWIDMYLPKSIVPYAHLARFDKPIGTWLLAWPCMWSIALAAPSGSLPDFKMMSLFGLGALLLRGAGCTVNDLLDRDIDVKVQRTKSRPIACGALTPFQGLCFLGFQLLLGLGVLLQLNNYRIDLRISRSELHMKSIQTFRVLGASSLLLVGSYPLMKRFTFWPQAYLGLTFNWGALLGWAAIHGSLDLTAVLPLYASGICWTLVYDTIYAHQDKEDDLKVGVKSTALRFGNQTKIWITGFGIACISSLTLSGFNVGLGWPFYVVMTIAAGHLSWQISTVDILSRVDCNRKFVSNKWFGALVFTGILLGRLAA